MNSLNDNQRLPYDSSRAVTRLPKRNAVAAACQCCRSHKLKCDGNRPCRRCRVKGAECIYTTRENETQRQANVRQASAVSSELESLRALFDRLATERDEDKAQHLFTLVRRQRSPASVLRLAEGMNDGALHASYLQELQFSVLLAAAQSAAPLKDIADLLTKAFSSHAILHMPPRRLQQALQAKAISIDALTDMLLAADSQSRCFDPSPLLTESSNQSPYLVPARPWTLMLDTDEEMSHFISIFFVWLNPFWRFVEEDIFLKALCSKDIASRYCSRFLVHAILAMTSLFCDSDKAFAEPGRYYSRGQHFIEEALRQQDLEAPEPSFTYVQALVICADTLVLLGEGAKGLALLIEAVDLLDVVDKNHSSNADDRRLVSSVHQVVVLMDLALRTNYKMSVKYARPDFNDLYARASFVSAQPTRWQPYPFGKTQYLYNSDLLAEARLQLIGFMYEANSVLFRDQSSCNGDASQIKGLIARFSCWHQSLDTDLKHHKDLPSTLVEFNAAYLQLQLLLHDNLSARMSPHIPDRPTADHDDAHIGALAFAFDAAVLVKDFRSAFGAKIIPSCLVPMSSMACFVLLKELRTPLNGSKGREQSKAQPSAMDASSALEELFRCLLAISLQQAFPMRVAQAVYNAALDMQSFLPDNVLRTLRLLIKPVLEPWKHVQVDSLYPDYSLHLDGDAEGAAATLVNMTSV